LNVTRNRALNILSDAEGYFAAMAIPFFVAVLNEYLVEAANILRSDGAKFGAQPPHKLPLGDLRKKLKEAGVVWPTREDTLMNVIQHVRNRIIHQGGVANQDLVDAWQSCPSPAQRRWRKVTRRPFAPREGQTLLLGNPEVRVALAVTRAVAIVTNQELARLVSTETWASLIVRDWQTERPKRSGDHRRDLRKLIAFSRQYYKPLDLSEELLEQALG
jgi:hypothetical protein